MRFLVAVFPEQESRRVCDLQIGFPDQDSDQNTEAELIDFIALGRELGAAYFILLNEVEMRERRAERTRLNQRQANEVLYFTKEKVN